MGSAVLVVEVLAPGLANAVPPRPTVAAGRPLAPGSGEAGGEEAYRLWRLLDRLRGLYGRRIVVHLIEPFSLTWVLRMLRHRPRRLPAFVLGGRIVVTGLDEVAVTERIAALLTPGAGHRAT